LRSRIETETGLVILRLMGSTRPKGWSRVMTVSRGRPNILANEGEGSMPARGIVPPASAGQAPGPGRCAAQR
jgi:hypothetical protein